MGDMTADTQENKEGWDELVHDLGGHPLQLWGWGEVKAAHGWRAERLVYSDESGQVTGLAQVLWRKLPWPFKQLGYVPRGPVCKEGHTPQVLEALAEHAKRAGGTVLTIEPDTTELPKITGWRQSPNTILIPSTLILDLKKSEDELLAAMTKKTRQYIRKSGREGLEVRQVTTPGTLAKCLDVYHGTAARAGFAIHGDDYYYDVHEQLGDSSLIFAAYKQGSDEPVAFVWAALSATTAFELYGGVTDEGQALRANYMLKWHAITTCKKWGVNRYDMNGLLNDGISTFKRGFADHEDMLVGTYDYPLSPLYGVWTTLLPSAKRAVRNVKKLVSR